MLERLTRILLTVIVCVLVLLSTKALADVFLPLVAQQQDTPVPHNDATLAHLIAGATELHSHAILYREWLDINEFEHLRALPPDLAEHTQQLVFADLHYSGDPLRATNIHLALLNYATIVCYDGDTQNDWITWLPQSDAYLQYLSEFATLLLKECVQ